MDDPGYWIEERVFSLAECEAMALTLANATASRGRAGARHLMSHPTVVAVANDERLLVISRRVLGPAAVPFRATLFEKTGRANWLVAWHQDKVLPLASSFESSEWGPWSIKAGVPCSGAPAWALERVVALRVHLDESAGDNGPLRVIPGSHRLGLLSAEAIHELVRTEPFVECQVGRGGVLAMRPLVVHSSSKAISRRPRRVLHIEYADALDLAPEIRLAVV
jgi:ectoine hydroxylase-related dioxygenase (phytanoyl-CoA dioxygenase family)